MKKLVAAFVLGVIVGGVVFTDAQVDAPITYRVPAIASDSTWTKAQRDDLRKQWNEFAGQCNTNTVSITGRLRTHTH